MSLKGKVAVVTGGAGWLGTPICETLAELGATVFIASRNTSGHDSAKDLIARLNPEAKIESVELDISKQESVSDCFANVIKQAGRIDVLINNAYSGEAASFDDTTLEQWQEVMDIGLTGYFLCIKEAAAHMQKARSGNIINVASMYGMVSPDFRVYKDTPFSSSPAYGAAKAGVIQLTKYTACSLAAHNIRVNAVSFGPFPSEQVCDHAVFNSRLVEKTPLGRTGSPWEVKGALAFLATDASSFVTGQNIVVDGGWTAW
jgi:NAD(P)-dependent dehydrogenase (short-subunit alcohol dehydrogenase family)